MEEILSRKGRVSNVYKLNGNQRDIVRKEFSPTLIPNLWNWFFYKSPHPLSTETGQVCAYWKRRLANRLATYFGDEVQICDGLELSQRGFTSEFIEGQSPTKNEVSGVYETTRRLEDFFDDIGMPTWSFSQRNPFSGSNFILRDGSVNIIDCESSVPVPDSRGHMGYDIVYFDDVSGFIRDHRQQILGRIGGEGMENLDEAFELSREYSQKLDIVPRKLTKFEEKFSKPLSKKSIDHFKRR